jgi:hypothetical protein
MLQMATRIEIPIGDPDNDDLILIGTSRRNVIRITGMEGIENAIN